MLCIHLLVNINHKVQDNHTIIILPKEENKKQNKKKQISKNKRQKIKKAQGRMLESFSEEETK